MPPRTNNLNREHRNESPFYLANVAVANRLLRAEKRKERQQSRTQHHDHDHDHDYQRPQLRPQSQQQQQQQRDRLDQDDQQPQQWQAVRRQPRSHNISAGGYIGKDSTAARNLWRVIVDLVAFFATAFDGYQCHKAAAYAAGHPIPANHACVTAALEASRRVQCEDTKNMSINRFFFLVKKGFAEDIPARANRLASDESTKSVASAYLHNHTVKRYTEGGLFANGRFVGGAIQVYFDVPGVPLDHEGYVDYKCVSSMLQGNYGTDSIREGAFDRADVLTVRVPMIAASGVGPKIHATLDVTFVNPAVDGPIDTVRVYPNSSGTHMLHPDRSEPYARESESVAAPSIVGAAAASASHSVAWADDEYGDTDDDDSGDDDSGDEVPAPLDGPEFPALQGASAK